MKIVLRILLNLMVLSVVVAAEGEGAGGPAADKSAYHLFNPTPPEYLRGMTVDGPGATESPYTVDAGHFQIEMTLFARSSYREVSEGVTYKFDWWSIGSINLKAGLFNNFDVQLILEPYNRAVEREVGFYRTSRSGVGDTALRFKLNLWGNDGGRTALALLPYFRFPTSDEGLGNDHIEGGLVVPFSLELPAGFYMGFTTQIAKLKSEDESNYHTEYRNSVSLSRSLFGDLDGYVEFFSAVSTEKDTQWIGTFNTGLAYWLSDDWQLNTTVEIGVSSWADDWYLSLGMAWRY
jgi:hypothetical protein